MEGNRNAAVRLGRLWVWLWLAGFLGGAGAGQADNPPLTGAGRPAAPTCAGKRLLQNREWRIERQASSIPEGPFAIDIDGIPCGTTKLLTFARRLRGTNRFPQVFVINSSGYLRLKAGADPKPPLPFGQSLMVGPALFGISPPDFPKTTLFLNPQLQTVSVDTSRLRKDGTGDLVIQLTAGPTGLPPQSTKINRLMNLSWTITLNEPTATQARIEVAEQFMFTRPFLPSPEHTAAFESFRLVGISSMFIDDTRHDVDALRYRDDQGRLVQLFYTPALEGRLLPKEPTALDPALPVLDSLHTDDIGAPNGNTPSYRITVLETAGPIAGPITPRLFLVRTDSVDDDIMALWLHQIPAPEIPAGTRGRIRYSVIATTDPLPEAGATGTRQHSRP